MGAEFYLNIMAPAGVLQAQIGGGAGQDGGEGRTGYTSLAYRRVVNDAGWLRFTLPGAHQAISLIANNSQVEVWRRNADMGVGWYRDFVGVVRGIGYETRGETTTFTADCIGILGLLGWREVAWYANTASRSTFTSVASETIMKTLVSYNAGANATAANGRIRSGVSSGLLNGVWTISNQADGGGGNTKSWSCAFDNLLDTLQQLQRSGAGGDFDLVKTAASTFEFRWYAGQLGTNRASTLTFSLDRGNMAEPSWSYDRMAERTVAIVGGQGENAGRVVVTRTGADYATTNDIERFVNGNNYETTSALNAIGDKWVYDLRARQAFRFKPLQAPNAYYGRDYFLGDLVTGLYAGASSTQKIQSATISHRSGEDETVDIEAVTNG